MKGIFSALLTPFDESGRVKTELAGELVDFYVKQRAKGIYLMGYTGEGMSMNVSQRKAWAKAVVPCAKGKLEAIIHVGYSKDPKTGIELAKHAGEIGADAVSSVGLSDEASLEENAAYFKAISDVSKLPFYVYWNSFGGNLNGGIRLDPKDLVAELKRQVPTFAGFKFTDSNLYYVNRIKQYDPDVVVMTGVDQMCVAGRLMGADGAIGALQAVTCEHFSVMWDKLHEGKIKEAMELQNTANHIYEALDEPEIGGLIPGLKYLVSKYYGIDVGYVCPGAPYHDLTDTLIGNRLMQRFEQNIYHSTRQEPV